MGRFDDDLGRVLSENFGGGVGAAIFLNFVNGIVSSADQKRAALALEKALALEPAQLAALIPQATWIGGLDTLHNYVKSNPQNGVRLLELAKRVVRPGELAEVSQHLASEEPERAYCPECGNRITMVDDAGAVNPSISGPVYYCENCDIEFSEDDIDEEPRSEPEPEYDQDADYYSQGLDSTGC